MNQGLKNSEIKIIQTFLASLCFIGALPLHADEHSNNEGEGVVAIHFGPGDADLVATEDSNEINSQKTIHSEN